MDAFADERDYKLLENDVKHIFASRYRLQLPTEEELQREMEQERKRIEKQEE